MHRIKHFIGRYFPEGFFSLLTTTCRLSSRGLTSKIHRPTTSGRVLPAGRQHDPKAKAKTRSTQRNPTLFLASSTTTTTTTPCLLFQQPPAKTFLGQDCRSDDVTRLASHSHSLAIFFTCVHSSPRFAPTTTTLDSTSSVTAKLLPSSRRTAPQLHQHLRTNLQIRIIIRNQCSFPAFKATRNRSRYTPFTPGKPLARKEIDQ